MRLRGKKVRKEFLLLFMFGVFVFLASCGESTNEPEEYTVELPEIELPVVELPVIELPEIETLVIEPPPVPVQEISSRGQQIAYEFLRGFPSLFQPLGMRDENTGEFYVLVEGEWVEISNLMPAEIPMVFQSGVRDGLPDGSFTDTLGIFFGDTFYNARGDEITHAPFIRGNALAYDFQLMDLDGDGIPEVLIRFVARGTQTLDDGRSWGYQFYEPIILFRLSGIPHTIIREIPLPAQPHGHYYATFPNIYINNAGEKIIFIHSEGHITERKYTLTLEWEERANPLVQIYSDGTDCAAGWWSENGQHLAQFHPLTDMQNEFHEKMNTPLEPWQIAYAHLLWEYATRKLGDPEWDDRIGGSFFLMDIDRDGIPELIVANTFHFTSYLAGYSYVNGKLVQLEIPQFFDYSAAVVVPVNNAPGLIQMFGEAWISTSAFFTLNQNRLEIKNSVTHLGELGTFYGEGESWYVNGNRATQEEYNAAFYEFFGFAHDFDWWYELERIPQHVINETNISRFVFGA
jgi:hypothetical protein